VAAILAIQSSIWPIIWGNSSPLRVKFFPPLEPNWTQVASTSPSVDAPETNLQKWRRPLDVGIQRKFGADQGLYARLFNASNYSNDSRLKYVNSDLFYASATGRRCQMHYVFGSSVRPSGLLFPRYLWHALIDFHRTSVSSVSWDRGEFIKFGIKRSKGKVTSWPKYVINAIFRVCFRDISGVLCWILFVRIAQIKDELIRFWGQKVRGQGHRLLCSKLLPYESCCGSLQHGRWQHVCHNYNSLDMKLQTAALGLKLVSDCSTF